MKGSKRIDELEPAVQINEDDSFIVQQSEATRKLTGNQINSHIQMVANKTVNPLMVLSKATGEGVVTINGTADYPLQSLVITGETLRDGIPQPNNPVIPVSPGDGGVISVKVCGKNLVDKNGVKTNYYVNASGEEVRDPSWCVATIPVFGGASIAITATTQGAAPRYCFYDDAGLLLLATQSKVINIPQSAKYAKLSVRTTELDGFMAEYGPTQTPYEPYKGQTATIPDHPLMSFGSATDTINPLTGDGLQTWGKIEFDGSEQWIAPTGSYANYTYCVAITGKALGHQTSICSHHQNVNQAFSVNVGKPGMYCDHPSNTNVYFVSEKPTLDDFKSWLTEQKAAGTPVTLWYQLAQPTTYQVTPAALRSYDGVTIITVSGASGEPGLGINLTVALNTTAVIAGQQKQIDELRELISKLQSAALMEEIGVTK